MQRQTLASCLLNYRCHSLRPDFRLCLTLVEYGQQGDACDKYKKGHPEVAVRKYSFKHAGRADGTIFLVVHRSFVGVFP